MSISRDEVARIAKLARLDLTAEERDGLTRDLAEILEYVGRLAALEAGAGAAAGSAGSGAPAGGSQGLSGVADTEAGPGPTPFREDRVLPSLPVEEALRPSADHDGEFFRVPAVIDRESGE